MSEVSKAVAVAEAAFSAVANFYLNSRYNERRFAPGVADLTFGNPQEMPIPGLISALREAAVPQDKNWFAYKSNEHESREFLADRVGQELGLSFEPDDFAITAGAFGAIVLAVHLLLDPGDEAISIPGP
jgi:aspartate aminotransferase